jgi:metal-dependent amidase/aminoacylase/carboxypeptidase family protein
MPVLMSVVESRIQKLLPELERVYTDIHGHPGLSMQETRTARIAADHLRGHRIRGHRRHGRNRRRRVAAQR